jgi:2-succinyl-5-enolpyruvyl-6-hydroxy-3-cyclohexene-1-carboxylate synthase
MEKKYYTVERNVQIVIALLKAHGIRKVIASPGTTNMTFVGSIQNDPFFEIYSSVDERSAAYLACGMAAESGEPVVISCTGATASRNYMSGLTEAYYRKLPVLAITSHRGNHAIGHLIDQQLDRRQIPADIALESVTVPLVKDPSDENFCVVEASKAILALKMNGGGPAHINLFTAYNSDFSVKELPPVRIIRRYSRNDTLPDFPDVKRVAISVGAHHNFTDAEVAAIEQFCATHDAVVFADHTSGYRGKYEVNFSLVCGQKNYHSPLVNVDLLIHIGEVSGDCYKISPTKMVWRISEDGAIRDRFKKLTSVFMMSEVEFFKHYSREGADKSGYLAACQEEYKNILSQMPEIPFGNIWMAKQMTTRLPMGCEFHMGIYNSLRSWNFFRLPQGIHSKCNVGGFGIDGGVSTMMGASLANPKKLFVGVFGELAFFYDMNVVANRHIGKNVRLMVVNNGRGTEFRNYDHPCSIFGEDADPYMAAAGHFGNKSFDLLKHYAMDLGYEYLSASNKEEFLNVVDRFLTPEITDKPIIFEVFTNTEDESDALELMLNYAEEPNQKVKKIAKDILGEKGFSFIKKTLGKK